MLKFILFKCFTGSRPVSAPAPAKSYKKPSQDQTNKPKPSKPKAKEEDFPSLPVSAPSKRAPTTKPTSYKPPTVIKTTPQPPSASTASKQSFKKEKSRTPFADSDEDDFPGLSSGPSIDLNNFSRKTVASSGQDLGYSSAPLSSNIRTVDRSVLEQPATSSRQQPSSVSVGSTAEFPGLGRPQQKLDLNFTYVKKAGKKNKNVNKNNNDTSYASKSTDKATEGPKGLNSICDFLGGGTVAAAKPSDIKPKPKEDAEVKPIASKVIEEDFVRPSKTKAPVTNNNNNTKAPAKKVEEGSEEFPTLGKSSKKLSRNFVSAEEKLVQKKSVFNQWGKNISQVEQNLQNTHISQKNVSPTKKLPPGFGRSRGESYKYSAPSDFQQRNAGLITTITDMIGGKSLEFKTFKEISGRFRAGQMNSAEYYIQCKELMVQPQFSRVFPELLALLPDITKQEQLYELYKQDSWFEDNVVNQCEVCRQISLFKDQNSHMDNHGIDEDFPQL